MRIRNLYLSIYLTVLAVLLVFALVAGLLVRHHAEGERERFDAAFRERTLAWADLIEKSLPGPQAPKEAQREALVEWGRRLRLPLALNAADGHRIAASQRFTEDEALAGASERMSATRAVFKDGRVLLIASFRAPWRRPGPPGGGFAGGSPPDRLSMASSGEGPPGPPDGPGGERPSPPHFAPRPPPMGVEGLMRWSGGWWDEGSTLLALVAVLFLAIAVGSYPVVRRLTRRLELLQQGVEAFGAGQLSHRVPADGGDEVASVAASFNRAAERIEGLVRSNRSLLANASHELRSPLARMKMALAMLESTEPGRRDILQREIERDIAELDALVEEVLLASRLDAQNQIAHDPVDLLALAAEEAARVDAQVAVDEAGAALRLQGDERLLRRALRNLLENARRYGGDEVSVEIAAAGLHAGVEVAVCDRGQGVPMAERERIFEPFYRLPGHSEKEGGVGLGLSLVRQIAERHGGTVRCEARTGGGSRFVLALPSSTVATALKAPG